jgi:hypothetical protein
MYIWENLLFNNTVLLRKQKVFLEYLKSENHGMIQVPEWTGGEKSKYC